ncbi:hypothetical protein CPB86DRAFT_519294 [Serendipita vermifera]|nr:hypothetical protein CPB86DRAFT_519294 [Serendipita vermifera]
MLSLQTMPLDVVQAVMTCLWSRADLRNLIFCSRSMLESFQEHPNSIFRKVVCREFDLHEEVLPLAWSTTNAQMYGTITHQGFEDITISASRFQIHKLGELHDKVKKLLRIYSVRCKSTRILQNTLTPEESRRVQLAIYCFWRYKNIYLVRVDNLEFEKQLTDTRFEGLGDLPDSYLLFLRTFKKFLLNEIQNDQGLLKAAWSDIRSEYGLTRGVFVDSLV